MNSAERTKLAAPITDQEYRDAASARKMVLRVPSDATIQRNDGGGAKVCGVYLYDPEMLRNGHRTLRGAVDVSDEEALAIRNE